MPAAAPDDLAGELEAAPRAARVGDIPREAPSSLSKPSHLSAKLVDSASKLADLASKPSRSLVKALHSSASLASLSR